MIAEEIPAYLKCYVDKINSLGIFDEKFLANHILLNEYQKGQGIMSHSDGPMFHPVISTISLNSHTVLEFTKSRSDDYWKKYEIVPEFKLIIEPRSLIILKDELYNLYLHGISEIETDNFSDPLIRNIEHTSYKADVPLVVERSTRYSITIRNFPNTSKLKLKFFK
jgi:alkylated DNA repair protein alkB family protein 6